MIIEKPKLRPPVITFFGEPGCGKTTLASMFPKALIIRLEDGVESVPEERRPAIMPVVRTLEQLETQLDWVFENRREHGRKTLIVDSITQGEIMFEKHVIDNDPNLPLSINQACGGFGAGVKAVGKIHVRIREKLERINLGGMAVIILAHATTDTVEPPDGQNYSRYNLRLGKHSLAPWVDNVDMVGFICLQKIVRGAVEDKKIGNKAGKAISDGTRQIVCHLVAGNVSKNRYGIEDAIELPPVSKWENPLLPLIPYYVQALKLNAPEKAEVKPETKPEPEPTPERQPDPLEDADNIDQESFSEDDVDPNDYAEPEL